MKIVAVPSASENKALEKMPPAGPAGFRCCAARVARNSPSAPWYQDSGWLLPLLIIGVTALLLTAVFWPITAIVRRSFGAKPALDADSLRAYRLSKLAAIAIVLALGVWGITLSKMIGDINNLSAKFDTTVHFAQLLGFVAFIGGCAVLWWHVAKVWGGSRRWPAKLWSIVLALSASVILWTAFVFKLLTLSVNY